MPPTGSHLSMTPKTMINTMPSQKLGTLTPARAVTWLVLSIQVFCLTALITPNGSPITIASRMLEVDRMMVLGRRTRIASITACWDCTL